MSDNTDLKDAYYYDEEKTGSVWKRVLAIFLGILFGILCTFGAGAGIAYYALTKMSTKKVVSIVSDLTDKNIHLEEYISDDYAEKSVMGLLSGVLGVAEDFKGGEGSISQLEQILSEEAYQKLKDKFTSTLEKNDIELTDEQLEGLLTSPIKNIGKELKTSVLEPMELGELLQIAKVDMNDLLVLLCYGEKDVDYVLENGEYKSKEGGDAFLTIGDLLKENGTDALMNRLTVSAMLKTNGEPDYTSAILRALCFGEENRAFVYDESNESPTFLPLSFELSEKGDSFRGTNGKTFELNEDSTRWEHTVSGEYILTSPPSGERSAQQYAYYLYAESGELKYGLTADETGAFVAYDEKGAVVKNAELTILDLMNIMNDGNDGIVSLFSAVELGELLQLDGNSPTIMLALAYGELNVDYTIDKAKKIVPLDGGKKPVTFGELTDSEKSEALFDALKLSSVLTVNRADAAMMGLIYGTEGKHYVFPVGAEKPTMLPVVYRLESDEYHTEKYLHDDEHTLLVEGIDYTVYDEGVYEVKHTERGKTTPKTYYAMHPAEADEGVYYLYDSPTVTPTPESAVHYREATLGDLSEDAETMINTLDLGSVLGISPLDENPSKILLALAYGSEGKNYEIVEDERGNKSIRWLTNPSTGRNYSIRTVADLRGDNAKTLIDDIQLTAILDEDRNDAVIMYLLYGMKGVNYEIDHVTDEIVMLQKQVAIYEDESSGSIEAYDERGILLSKTVRKDPTTGIYIYTDSAGVEFHLHDQVMLENGKPYKQKLQHRVGEDERLVTDELDCYRLYETVNGVEIPLYYTPHTFGEMKGKGENADSLIESLTKDLTIGQLLVDYEPEHAPVFLKTIENWSISDLEHKENVEALKLGQVIDINDESHNILRELRNTQISELSDPEKGIGTLTLTQILGETAVKENFILKHLANDSIDTISTSIENLTIQQVFENDIYKKDGNGAFVTDGNGNKILTGTWKYLLTVNGVEQFYKVKEFSSLVTNMTNNMKVATLNELANDLNIDIDEEFRNKTLVVSITVGTMKYEFLDATNPLYAGYFDANGNPLTFGELNITQLVNYTKNVMEIIGTFETP